MRAIAASTVAVLCLAVVIPVAASDPEAGAPGMPLLRYPDVGVASGHGHGDGHGEGPGGGLAPRP